MMPTRFRPCAKPLCAIGLSAAALLIAACGGSSSTRSATTPIVHSAATTSQSATASKSIPYADTKAGRDVVSTGVVTHRPLNGTGGGEINDDNPGRADTGGHSATGRSDPCTLVSRAQAQAIVGKPIGAPVDAPLGPTCIYQPAGAKSFITVAVESIDFSTIKPLIHNRTQSTIDGRAAYCGTYGQPTTFVPLSNGRTLDIAAPCSVGVRFAAEALPRL